MDSYKKNAMLDEYSTVSVVVIDTVVNALLYIIKVGFYNKRRIHYRRSICFYYI